jgi:hypothetical protein
VAYATIRGGGCESCARHGTRCFRGKMYKNVLEAVASWSIFSSGQYVPGIINVINMQRTPCFLILLTEVLRTDQFITLFQPPPTFVLVRPQMLNIFDW